MKFCFLKPYRALRADRTVSVDLGSCLGLYEREIKRRVEGNIGKSEERQNKDIRSEHCGFFTMSSQKKKGGIKLRCSKNDFSKLHSTQSLFQYKYKRQKEIFFRFVNLIS